VDAALSSDKGELAEDSTSFAIDAAQLATLDAIQVSMEVSDIQLETTTGDAITVDYEYKISKRYEYRHTFSHEVSNNTLKIKQTFGEERWINLGSITTKCKLVIGIPENWQPQVKVDVDVGKISIANMTLADMDLESDTGKVSVSGVIAPELEASSDVGDVHITDCAIANVNARSDAGEVVVETSDSAPQITAKSNVGKVTITLSKDASFQYSCATSVGSVKLDNLLQQSNSNKDYTGGKFNGTYNGGTGRVEATTDVGEVTILIQTR